MQAVNRHRGETAGYFAEVLWLSLVLFLFDFLFVVNEYPNYSMIKVWSSESSWTLGKPPKFLVVECRRNREALAVGAGPVYVIGACPAKQQPCSFQSMSCTTVYWLLEQPPSLGA